MARKATEQVTTIGIDIGKNTFHLIGFDDRSGSTTDSHDLPLLGPLAGAKRKSISSDRTSDSSQ